MRYVHGPSRSPAVTSMTHDRDLEDIMVELLSSVSHRLEERGIAVARLWLSKCCRALPYQ